MKAHHFERSVKSLHGWREMAFCLALAERAWPNYALFCQVAEFPHDRRLQGILDEAWNYLKAGRDDDPFQWLIRMEEGLPDPDSVDMYGVHPAIDFWSLLEHAWLSQTDSDKPRALLCSELSRQTVQAFVEMSEGQGLDDEALVKLLDRSPFMKQELDFQVWLIETLRKQGAPDVAFLDDLRADAANEGFSNLGVSLADNDDGTNEVPGGAA